MDVMAAAMIQIFLRNDMLKHIKIDIGLYTLAYI
jgi:hypothetical protein